VDFGGVDGRGGLMPVVGVSLMGDYIGIGISKHCQACQNTVSRHLQLRRVRKILVSNTAYKTWQSKKISQPYIHIT